MTNKHTDIAPNARPSTPAPRTGLAVRTQLRAGLGTQDPLASTAWKAEGWAGAGAEAGRR